MSFKKSDVATSLGLAISGYMREEETDERLIEALSAAAREIEDWAEVFSSEQEEIEVFILGPHSPVNITSAMKSLRRELVDLMGDDWVSLNVG